MARVGDLLLWGALGVALLSMVLTIYGVRTRCVRAWHSARGAVVAVAVLVTGAVGILEYELVTSNFSVVDVADNTSRNLSLFLKLTALWSGSAGSLLFWVWVLSLYAAYVVGRKAQDEAPIVPYAGLILSGATVFYLAMVTAVVSPFTTTASPPYDGSGLDPLLQNVWMAVHPPAMYMGFIGLTVPFAWGMGALWARSGGDLWVRLSRRWLLVAWTFLTAALVLGGYWAYTELGWGGYWAWDPVENAAFMPWIVATALIHSGMVQERRGAFRVWNVFLLAGAFALAVFGTFLTRSGFLPSIHTFSQSPVSLPLGMFFAATLVFSVITVVRNRDLLQDASRWESYFSKEFAFLLNNVLLLGAAFSVLWGTLYPIISRDFLGQEMTVTESFFTNAVGPFVVLLLLAMGAATAVGWRRTSWRRAVRLLVWPVVAGGAVAAATGVLEPGLVRHLDWRAVAGFGAAAFAIAAHVGEFGRAIRARLVAGHSPTAAAGDLFARHPHRYLGYVVHIAFALMFIGIAGSWLFQQRTTLSLSTGQSVTIGGVPMTFQGITQRMQGVDVVETAILRSRATGGALTPEFIVYPGNPAPLARVAIMHGVSGDLYVVLAEVRGGSAVLEFFVNPLVTWFWGGALLMVGCMVLLLVTNPRTKTEVEREARGLGAAVHPTYLVEGD